MSAMWSGFAAIVIIAVVAGAALSTIELTAEDKFSTENVRVK